MQTHKVAIETRYLGPSNYRGSRIVASDGDKNRATISYPYVLNSDEAHALACRTVRDKMGWKGDMVGGGFDGDMYWVFTADCRVEG